MAVFLCSLYILLLPNRLFEKNFWKGTILTNPKKCVTIALQLQEKTQERRNNGKEKNVID